MKKYLLRLNALTGCLVLVLGLAIEFLCTPLARAGAGSEASLYVTYTQGAFGGHSAGDPQADTAQIPIHIFTDSDSPVGTHTVTWAPIGGGTSSSAIFSVGPNGVVNNGNEVVATPSYTATNLCTPPYVPVNDDVPPDSHGNPQHDLAPITNSYLFQLDYNSALNTSIDFATTTITSNFYWDTCVNAFDSTYGWQSVFYSQPRPGAVYQDGIALYLPGSVIQDPFGKRVYPPGCQKCCGGMAVASFDQFQSGISISDAPVGYNSVLGGSMTFQITYHQRLNTQPSILNFSNLGAKWSFNWLSYITGGVANSMGQATYFAPGGSQYTYGGYTPNFSTGGSTYVSQGDFGDNQAWDLSTLHYRQSPERYERWLPDGTVEIFAQVVGGAPNKQYFLSSIQDPLGNTTTLSYDSTAAANGQAILTSVTDPTGQQLVFHYDSSDSLKITRVTRSTDGLSARFGYTNGQLTSSTDTIGITSSFAYTAGSNFISSMTTPYGTTLFNSTDGTGFREADMTNPLGQNERIEYIENVSTGLMPSEIAPPSDSRLSVDTSTLNQRNTFYWTRRAMQELGTTLPDTATGYAKAIITHWAKSSLGSEPIALSSKKPLEDRAWYNYPYQTDANTLLISMSGTMVKPSVTARTVDSSAGTVKQITTATYNHQGLITQSVDPVGRTTNYSYYHYGSSLNPLKDDIDPYQVTQIDGGTSDILSTMSNYIQHLPQQIVDAAGQPTTLAYNTQGQLTSRTVVVNSANQVTTMTYTGPSGTGTGNYLTLVTGPVTGATTKYTYDSDNRVQTVTDSENYTVTNAYDNLDRPVSVTYPDGTSDQTYYHNLDVDHTVDRQGRTTSNKYDAIRELVQTTDPLGSITKFSWCTCGGLSTLTDANNNVTTWGLDTEGRVISKTYADSSAINYLYETNSSRLHTMTDANSNVATYTYNSDNTLAGTSYSATNTPPVSFFYDPVYNRVTSMVDGGGTNSYAYNPVNGALGAGRLASATVPIYGTGHTATVSYKTSAGAAGYDELGRVVSYGIDSTNYVGTTFDALGRVTNVTNALAPASPGFQYGYVNQTSRLQTATYPASTGMTTTYSYFPSSNTQDFERLQEIKNLQGSTPVSDQQYTYNAVGTIKNWSQQSGSGAATVNQYSYDADDQLTGDTQVAGNIYGYTYDPAGNQLTRRGNSGWSARPYNNLNQLTGLTNNVPATTAVGGHTSAAVSIAKIDEAYATITSGTNFAVNIYLPPGTNMVSVVAQPTGTNSAPLTTQRYQMVVPGTLTTQLTYDANGNCTKDENGNSYQWDGLNRLTKITYATGAYTNSAFAYDGLSRRVQIVDTTTGGTATTRNDLWIGSAIAQERASNGTTINKQFVPQGEQQSGTNYYYTRDHLGSVREMLNSSGTIVARYSYDPYGRTSLVSGTNLATKQYTGDYTHQASGLNLTLYRAYDPNTGRWLSRDPLAERGGLNLYDYVLDNPIDAIDPLGLQEIFTPDGAVAAAAAAEGMTPEEWLAAQAAVKKAAQMAATAAAAVAAEKALEYGVYKARCNQSPPPGLCPCDLWKWKLQRNKDCQQLRTNFTKKWYPNGGDAGHQNAIDELDVANAKLEALIKRLCP